MVRKALLALLSLALVVLMPACKHKDEGDHYGRHHHHGKTETVETQEGGKEKVVKAKKGYGKKSQAAAPQTAVDADEADIEEDDIY